ncbi:Uncharacterised protein [Mycobacteroides abscessus subsp. abscessus]|nr:Uncharacterised protein [Mycobacteroides abscessus subsp. abscessus]
MVHATGRHAASSKDNQAGFGTRLRVGTVRYSAKAPSWRSDSNARSGSSVSSPIPASGLAITGYTMTSLPSWSNPAASQPSTIGSRSAGCPTPRNVHRSCMFKDEETTRTTDHPEGGVGMGRSLSTRPASGSAALCDSATAASMCPMCLSGSLLPSWCSCQRNGHWREVGATGFLAPWHLSRDRSRLPKGHCAARRLWSVTSTCRGWWIHMGAYSTG